MAKVQDVAALSGLSTSTVSRYLNKNGYVSKKAAAKIEKAIAELDFRPSFLGRSLKYNRSSSSRFIKWYHTHSLPK